MKVQAQESSSKASLIVIDGADNAGKATQTALLKERLLHEGKKVETMDFPQYTQNTFGRLIKECLAGQHGDFLTIDPKIASTLYAADRFESKERLLKLLAENDIVLLDRYVSANMLHQGAKILNEGERHDFLSWLNHIEYGIFGMPKPDLTIFLSLSAQHSDEIHQAIIEDGEKIPDIAEVNREHQRQVASCLLWLSTMQNNWVTLHCSQEGKLRSKDNIHKEIYNCVIEQM